MIGKSTSSGKVSGDNDHESEERQKELVEIKEENVTNEQQMQPGHGTMTKLILFRVWKKLSVNPNLYASVLGIVWALISARYFAIFLHPKQFYNSLELKYILIHWTSLLTARLI